MIRELVKQTLSKVGLSWITGLLWYRQVLAACRWPENTSTEIDRKTERFRELANRNSYGRALIWEELARLEHLRGHQLIATIFALRTMRLTGRDQAGHLPWVLDSLQELGFEPEAIAAKVMFGDMDFASRFRECQQLLTQSFSVSTKWACSKRRSSRSWDSPR